MATHLKIPRVLTNPQWITILPIGLSRKMSQVAEWCAAPYTAAVAGRPGRPTQGTAVETCTEAVRHRCEAKKIPIPILQRLAVSFFKTTKKNWQSFSKDSYLSVFRMGSCQIFVIHPLPFWKTYNLNYDYLCIISSQKKTILELQIADLFDSDLPGAVFRFKDFAGWLLNVDPSTASQRRVSDRRLCATEIFMALVVPKSWTKKLAIISRKLKPMFTTTKKKAREKKHSGASLRHGFISRMASFFSAVKSSLQRLQRGDI